MKQFFLFLSIFFCANAFSQTAPIARADTFYVCPGDTFVLNPLANDNDPDGDSIFLITFTNPNPAFGSYTKKGDSVIFIAAQNFPAQVTGEYSLCDSSGLCAFSNYVILKDANCTAPIPNRAPTASPDFYFGLEDFLIALRPLENDNDPDGDPLAWTTVTQPLNGTIILNSGNFFYRGNQNYNGIDFFLYRACDPQNRCATSIITIVVAPINDQPRAVNDTFVINEDEVLKSNVLVNDIDVDGDKLKANVTQQPFNGSVVMDSVGNFTYTPNKNYFGKDEFRYRACDTARFLNCSNARVLITILPVNDAPEMTNIMVETETLSGIFTEDLSNHAKDPEKDSISYFLASKPKNNKIQVTLDGKTGAISFTLPDDFCGTDSFLFSACDYALCDTAVFFIKTKDCVSVIDLVEGFSPNGDGINDKFVFTNLEKFTPAYFVVFNRNGNPIYESEDYQNDWDGTSMQSGQPLPDGTYYYVLELAKGGGNHKNFVVINR